MKVLLDENLPHRLRFALVEHEVTTAVYAGWSGFKNGELLRLAEAAGYDVLLTADRNLAYQQNLTQRKIAIVVLTAQEWDLLSPHVAAITDALNVASPGSFCIVACG